MRKHRFKWRQFFALDFYYLVLRKDWQRQTVAGDILLKILAVLVLSIHRFVKDACSVSASALTFYSVLSFIPVVALVLGIAKGFGAAKLLEDELRQQSFANPQITEFIVQFANQALEHTKGGVITGIGIVILLWSVIKVLDNAELAMNRIWGVIKGRSLTKKITDYFSILFIAPILFILISSINVFLTTNIQDIAIEEGFFSYAGSLIYTLVNISPYVLVWMLFIFLYMFMPTTPVKFKYAVVAGILAGTAYQIVQWFYLRFQVGVSSYNAIYGSLAALPLLLIWLQLSWSIVLWGTELCYVLRNRHFLFKNAMDRESRWVDSVELATKILRYISYEYMQDKGGVTLGMVSKKLKVSITKLRTVTQELVDKNVLVEIKTEDDIIYLPVIDLHNLSLAEIIIRLSDVKERNGGEWESRFMRAIKNEFGDDRFA